MATFTHSITWTVSIDGRSTTYSYEYDVEDVIDVQRVSVEEHINQTVALAQEPVLTAYLNKHPAIPGSLSLANTAGPTSVAAGVFREGEMFVVGVSDEGGTWNSTGVNNTTTLKVLNQLNVGGTANRSGNYDLLILHQAAS